MADHFQPIIWPLAYLSRIITTPLFLPFSSILVTISGIYPIYLIGRRRKAPSTVIFASAFAYLFFIGIQFAMSFTWHPSDYLAPLLLWAYAISIGPRRYLIWIPIIIALALKEDVGFYVAFLGILIFADGKRGLGSAVGIVGLISFYVVNMKLMPYFLGPSHIGTPFSSLYGYLGATPIDVARTGLSNPGYIVSQALSNSNKWADVLTIFSSGALLPLIGGGGWLLILPNLIQRLLSSNPNHSVIVFHYGASLAAGLALSIFIGYEFVAKRWNENVAQTALFAVILGTIITTFAINAPIYRVFISDTYKTDETSSALSRYLKTVPGSLSVSAQDSTLAHVDHRASIYLFPGYAEQADVVVLRLDRSYWPDDNLSQYRQTVQGLIESGDVPIYSSDNALVLAKNGARVALSSQWRGFLNQTN